MQRGRQLATEGEGALGRGDHAGAARAFSEAAAAYQAARAATDALRHDLERARAQAATARKGAADAKTPELARESFEEGTRKEREAEALAGGQQLGAATQAYVEAARLLTAATEQARALTDLRGQADRAREQMRAEKQKASTHAAGSEYKSALAREGEADRAYGGQRFAEARDGFAAASGLYVRAWSGPKVQAERARDAAREARSQADQATAPRNAPDPMNRGRQHESRGDEAFDRNDYDGAVKAFALAGTAYQEARAATDALRRTMEQARAQAKAAARDAADAKAGELAREPLDEGLKKEREADDLAGKLQLAAAGHAYQESARLLVAAASRARTQAGLRGQADQARAQMRAEKQTAGPYADTLEFKAAAAREGEADRTYQRLLFADARDGYAAASGLYARASVGAKAQAERARDATRDARGQADQAGAPRNAPDPVNRGRQHEAQGDEALNRLDYGAAAKAYALAGTAYLEAKTATDGLKRAMDQARAQAATARKEATEALAGELAREALEEAAKKEREAEGLAGRQQLAAAGQAYQQTSRLLAAATAHARTQAPLRTQASRARDQMRADKQRASRYADSSDYKAGAAREAEADQAYGRQQFAQARDAFGAAASLYAKAAARPPDPPKVEPQPLTPEPSKPPAQQPPPRRAFPVMP
jgi:hypothetical protein